MRFYVVIIGFVILCEIPTIATANDAVDYASTQMGKTYLLGATGPDQWDCSSLVQWACKQANISIHRVTFDQVNDGQHVSRGLLQRGDLVFFHTEEDSRGAATHVGIFVSGSTMIDANSYAGKVKTDNIDDSYWKPAFLFGVRIPSQVTQQSTSNSTIPKIGFKRAGILYVQDVNGRNLHLAVETERKIWGSHAPHISLISPNGKYRAVTVNDTFEELGGDSIPSFVIVENVSGKHIVSTKTIRQGLDHGSMPSGILFNGWLPDSTHFEITSSSHIAGVDDCSRCIVDVQSGHIISFNGWISQNQKIAIVPSQEKKVSTTDVRTDARDKIGNTKWTHTGPEFCIISLNIPITNYKFRRFKHKWIKLGSDFFRIELSSNSIQFSNDNKWVLYCRSQDAYERDFFTIDLSTGSVNKIHCNSARFISP